MSPHIGIGDRVSAAKLRCDGPGKMVGKVHEIRGGLILLGIGDHFLVWVRRAGARRKR